MAKINILTFHFSNNLGAMLQAYGLAQAVKAMGHDVQIIDYRPWTIRKACERPLWRYRHPVRLIREVLFRHRIRNFRKTYLPLTRTYLDLEELRRSPPQADCIIVGSDQVWNISSPIRGFDPTFFLEFLGSGGPRRVSYAASVGNGTELGEHRKQISDLLSRFDHISVRDVTSQKLVQLLVERRVEHVLDPSFLIDYDAITPPPIVKPPYILAYCFRRNELSSLALRSLRERLGLPVVSINLEFDQARRVDPGPLQWLSLMKYASFICTDSFHGTCFSLINKTQFVTLEFKGGMTRLEDLLQTSTIPERLVSNRSQLEYALSAPIDFHTVSSAIAKARESSLSFLRDALLP